MRIPPRRVWQAANVTPDDVQRIADRVVAQARQGEQVEVVVSWGRDTEVRAYGGEVEHFVSAESAGVGIRVIHDRRQGLGWVGALHDDAVAACLSEARDNATFSSPDPNAGLAEPDGVAPAELELLDERLAEVPTDNKIAAAIELEAAVRRGDPRVVGVESADYADSMAATAISSTTGVRVAGAESSAYLGAYALAADDDGTTTGFGHTVARGFEGLDLSAAASDAVERSVRLLGAQKAPSRRLTVVLDPYVTSQLLGVVAEMLSGEAVLRGRTPFADRVGEAIGSPLLTLVDDATDPSAPTASDVDGEGLACRTVPLITEGRLDGFLHNAYTARALGERSTGSAHRGSFRGAPSVGPHVVTLRPGSTASDDLLAQAGDGLWVHELVGLHSGVNPVSGDLSVGVEGQLLRNGTPVGPVREVTIASTVQRLLDDVIAVGDDLTYFPWDATGVSLVIADVMMSGR